MIFHNAHILTMRRRGETARALTMKGEQIVSLDAVSDARARTVDLQGRTVIPAFCDAHTHFYYWARTLDHIDFEGVRSLEEALARVAQRVASTPKGRWIEGLGYNKNFWTPPEFPSRAHLDRVAPEHPVAVFSKDQHSYWVNSAALRAAGVDGHTPDPPGGQIVHDAQGEPTGILFENAYKLVEKAIPVPSPAESSATLDHAATLLHRLGVTAIHDMGGLDAWEAYTAWRNPTIDTVKYIPVERIDYVERAKLRSGKGHIAVRFAGLKLFTDGALGSQTAYMWEPYIASHGTGVSRMSPDELEDHLAYADAHHLACAIHAIGDRANAEVIEAAQAHPARRLRHRIEHAQSVRFADIERLAPTGWVASMQPSHLVSDRDTSLRYWGEKRSRYAFPIGSLQRAGVPLAFGSDVPIDPVDPLLGIYAACCRKHPEDARGPWEPGQCIDRYTALHAFTAGAAYAAGEESETGTIAPGMRANLTILDRDPLTVPDEELRSIRVLATIYAGKPAYVNESEPELARALGD